MSKDIFRLDNKVVLLIGGNGYLGKQFSKVILDFGGFLYSCDLNIKKNETTDYLHKKYSDKYKLIKVDATKKEELLKLSKLILKEQNSIDVLINCVQASCKNPYLPFEEFTENDWNLELTGNLTIPFLTSQIFIPIMKKKRKGSVINIASIYGIVGNDQRIYKGANLHEVYLQDSPKLNQIYSPASYAASKAGVIQLSRYLAAYYGKDNIRVNTLTPGGIYQKNENETFVKKYSEKVPLGRKANQDEMNGALIFLASDASAYVTGHNLVVDGGYTIW